MPNHSGQHTPAPWRYEESTKTIRAVPNNYWLATMDSWDGMPDHAANARLIAAAPELLKSLVELTDWMRDNTGPGDPNTPHEALVRAMECIAKATR